MADNISKTQRWLDLIAFLVGRRFPVSVEEVMEAVPAYGLKWSDGSETDRASVRRTFERDKDELRGLGIPLETVSYSVGRAGVASEGYRIQKKDFYLPYLRLLGEARDTGEGPGPGGAGSSPAGEVQLREDEATHALDAVRRVLELPAFPLRRQARSAFRKLAFDLEPERFAAAPILYLDPPGSEELLHTVQTLTDALLRRKRVGFRYHGIYRGEATDRRVRPWGLLFQQGHWYLVAWDENREAVRVFRAGRMEALEVNRSKPATADYAIPDDFSLEDHRDRQAWELGGHDEDDVIEARVRFDFPRSLWAERNDFGTLEEEEEVREKARAAREGRAEGTAGKTTGDRPGARIRRFRVSQPGPFLRWILGLGGDARVLGPEPLKAELEAMARTVAERHGGAR